MARDSEDHSASTEEIKASLREKVLKRRDAMPPETQNTFSRAILRDIIGLEPYKNSGVVLAYAGFGSELRTDEFLHRTLDLGKRLLLPRVNRETKSLDLYEVKDLARDLKAGTWGISEPDPGRCDPADIQTVDFVLVPGVAFDSRCGRLGYGAGFYDGLLANRRVSQTWLVAGAFEVQVVESVPMRKHDVPVDLVMTQERHYPS
ncbi:MAG: 5-formyltetrahydrofolate cyclo-ligase [Rubrobacteraceae bacterium]|nr:5-formyltetrahydrofolate cyclo-ligase [Rubrobacter sp.]